ncbi:tape measure protein [Thiolinea disciformis]|uniref:tape measure protein n=1 Tax=Thiolinea disciformis TaxID=125614 RepID=UPI0003618AA6|nr:tape measure protein [Thiolinea disciformis]
MSDMRLRLRISTDTDNGLGVARQQADALAQSINQVRNSTLALLGIGSIAQGATQLAGLTDEYTNLQSRLKLVTDSSSEMLSVQTRLDQMANTNRQSLSATVNLYAGIEPAMQKAGRSQAEILKAVDSVNKGLVVGGATAQGSAASILQLTQALGSGVLRGDEFNSIMENGRGIADALATALGKDTGQLRMLAEQGKLTSNVVIAALIEQNDELTTKFEKMPMTISQSFTVLRNNVLTTIGEFDQANHVSETLAKTIAGLGQNLEYVAVPAAMLGTYLAGSGLSAVIGYVAAVRAQITANLHAAQSNNLKLNSAVAAAQAELAHRNAIVTEIEALMASSTAINAAVISTRQLTPAKIQAMMAANAHTEALAAQRAGLVSTSLASRALSGTLALLGGPLGVAMIAAGSLYYLKTAHDEARHSVELADGSEYSFAESLQYVSTISNEYRTASQSRQKEIRAEIELIIAQTEARKKEADQQLKHLAQLNSREKVGVFGWAEELGSKFWNGNEKDNKAIVAETSDSLQKLRTAFANLGKTQEEIDAANEKNTVSTKGTAVELLNYSDTAKKAQDVAKKHADTLKSTTEQLTRQRLEFEQNAQSAKYFADRLAGLQEQEAKLAAGSDQYTSFLRLRQQLMDEHKTLGGGLVDEFNVKLRDAGLDAGALNFSAAEAEARKAIAAQLDYQRSIEESAKLLTEQGQSSKDAAQSVVLSAENTKKALSQVWTTARQSVGDYFREIQGLTATHTQQTEQAAVKQVSVQGKMLADMRAQSKKHAESLAVINRIAAESGVDATQMRTVAWIESRFNASANRGPKGAKGAYQFTPPTAAQYGIAGQELDIEANTRAYVRLLQDNTAALKKYGLQINGANTYLAHQQGSYGLKRIYEDASGAKPFTQSKDDRTIQANMRNNLPKEVSSDSASFLEHWRAKYNAIEAGIKLVSGAQSNVTQAVTKTTAATHANVVPLTTVAQRSQQIKDIKQQTVKVAEYQGQIDGRRMTDNDRNSLITQHLRNEADKLLLNAQAQIDATQQHGIVLRANELTQKQLTVDLSQEILQRESQADYLAEEQKLREQLVAIRDPNAAYKSDLAKKRLSDTQILSLAAQKQSVDFEKVKFSLEQQTDALKQNGEEQFVAAQKAAGLTGAYLEQAKALHYNYTLTSEHKKLAQELAAVNLNPIQQYGQQLADEVGVNRADVQVLVAKKQQVAFATVKKELLEQNKALKQNAEEQFAAAQQAAGLNAAQVREASGLHYANSLLAEQNKLRDEAARLNAVGARANAALDYQQAGFNPKDTGDLSQRKADLEGGKRLNELKQQHEQLTMTDEAYRRLSLSREQYSQGLTQEIELYTQQNEKLAHSRKLAEDLGGVFKDGVTGALQDMLHTGNSILDSLLDKIVESMLTTQSMQQMFNSMGNGVSNTVGMGGNSSEGFLSNLLSNLFASGGAFQNGTQFFATGGVVSRATSFAMSGNRMGVMGEAGPEAIMPLVRMGNGDLGVQMLNAPTPPINISFTPQLLMQPAANQAASDARAAPVVNIHIENTAKGVEVTQQSERDEAGNVNLKLLVRQVTDAQINEARRGAGLATVFQGKR